MWNVRRLGIAALMVTGVTWPNPVAAQDRLVQERLDPVTGAVVRVYKSAVGGSVEVQAATLTVRKQILPGKVVTTVKDGQDNLVIALDQRTLTVRTSHGRVTASRSQRADLARAKRLVAQSPVAARAAALIGRMGFGADTPVAPLLLTTRAVILAAMDDGTGNEDLSRWMRQFRGRAQVVKATFEQKTPTECWELYVKEALAAVLDYEACMKGLSYWDVLDVLACAVIYDVRAIGAFSWWLNCVSLLGVIGG